ncbi:thymidine phosphorylase [Actinopolyspora erythraea]|uniref:Pyrimidine-nucleoside phosphorylase n=1 Tax=Actinopolyspora erythraea TaxID=414996 RepID=A0A099D7X8_9ACTN|nr:thymidine phosphorylase [Actinopolyspora erythraea]ASU80006.1 thymidine phosphorylase [Actinopolyspora erythraea]KGI82268.1 pyrimidine-nucleoside phosphorylase [Actinopolyspora erythraea]
MSHSAVEVIRVKRDGGRLSAEQIDWVVDAYTRGEVAEEQMSALAMAILLRGMDDSETARWTTAMVDSGEVLDLGGLDRPTVDKHSTGGVGDKITLVLTPLVAACGAAVPQLSGRGLGHTGGTLDKLESIPGWRARLTTSELRRNLDEVGAVICAPTEGIAPADRRMYALRDVTGTVESVPLIAASIMSKKIAEGTASLVLDVKCGSGAFMTEPERARRLARTLVATGTDNGVRTSALLTPMSTPLGAAVGNALEVEEAVRVLRGRGPSDVTELTLALAREMLAVCGLSDVDPARVLESGAAYRQWRAVIAAQGGDPDAELPEAAHVHTLYASRSGTLGELDARAIGEAAWLLGAGRARKEDEVRHAAGIRCLAKPGDRVSEGDPLLELHTDDPSTIEDALRRLHGAHEITEGEVRRQPTVLERVGAADVEV